MWVSVLGLILGFTLLVWSADKFLSGAASTARNLGVSEMVIGLTVVSIGTSSPEIFVALAAAFEGNPLLAVGNAIGSNIANIGLVLGITALIAPLPFSKKVLQVELPCLLGVTLLALILMFDLELGPFDGILLLGALLLLCLLMYRRSSRHPEVADSIRGELGELPAMGTAKGLLWLAVGLALLVVSSELLVWSAREVALRLGVSDMLIGLTIVAVGTSLPELAATLGSVIKGHTDIAIGNVVGSNILNILAVLSLPGLIAFTHLEAAALWRDCGTMLALTLLLALFAYGINSRTVITRFEGTVLFLAWIGYNLLLIEQAL